MGADEAGGRARWTDEAIAVGVTAALLATGLAGHPSRLEELPVDVSP
ncbi:hypothetical protein AB0F11_27810 [Streptomyces sp. NPDC032472]